MGDATTRVFRAMLVEEWRLHTRLFGGMRFAAFPVLVALLVAGAVELLRTTGTSLWTAVAGLHALAFLFGLHTGSVGLVGRDALRDLLGDVTLLAFSARTLPLSPRRLLGVYVAKDLAYYAVLFLLPMAVGVLPAAGSLPGAWTGPVAVPALWAALSASFLLGMVATLAASGLAGRGIPGGVLLAAAGAGLGAAWWAGVDVVAWTPYGVFVEPSLAGAGATALAIVVLGAVAAVAADPTSSRRSRRAGPSLRRWRARVGDPVAAKSMLDLGRSSGGVWKVAFSAAVLFAVTAVLVDLASQITGASPSVGVSFGTVLGLSAFTTYNWLTRFDDVEPYLVQPLDVPDVLAGKLRAFLLVGPGVGLALLAVAVAWLGTPPGEALVGALLLAGVSVYVFGVTAYLAGFAPNEFLFDATLFAAFGLATVVPLVPILVLAFGYAPLSAGQLAGLAAAAVLLAALGFGAYRLARPRWQRHHRGR